MSTPVQPEWTFGMTLDVDGGLRPDEADESDTNYKPDEIDRRPLVDRQIRERRGQQKFRNALRERFGDICLVTGSQVLALLEAAHISPFRGEKDHHPSNGLLLRSDIHTMFDLDLLGIHPEKLQVDLHPCVAAEYRELSGCKLRCTAERQPSRAALEARYELFRQRLQQPA